MPFSYHSHSGQFCAHAKDKLEEVVQQAIKKEMIVFALTEHIGRDMVDLYPEEVCSKIAIVVKVLLSLIRKN
jgi:histidinol-phosphatase (PHP family)